MADRDFLYNSNEQDLNATHTPNRRLGMGSFRGSGQRSGRKSGKVCKLYTPKESHSVDENTDNSPEPYPKRKRLSSTSHNATIGNGSHIDTSFDVVDVTPGINGLQSLTFRWCLNNYTSMPGGNLKVTPKSMHQCDSFNKNDSESLSASPVTMKMYANGQKIAKEEKGLLCKKGSKSFGVSGITSLCAADTSPATSSKCSTPVCSAIGSTLTVADRMHSRQTEPNNHNKQDGLGHISKLIHKTPCRTDQVVSPRKSPQCSEEEGELPATQPVASLLLKGVVAYVEVRSGGDNRSMGIKAHLRSLGANVRDKFTNDVTHVVFNEGLLSTYKKAIKRKVHLVSVSWIEECKNAQTIVSERLYPPFDMAKYESPHLLKRFRKVKSLQPDFEDVGEEKIKKKRQKKLVSDAKENEPEIEVPEAQNYKKQIKVPEFLQNVSNENGLVRTLLSVADIGPEYEKIVNRPVSPTLSDEEDFSIPLAVRLLRKILTPQTSPELTSSREETSDRLKMTPVLSDGSATPGAENIQETPKRQCGRDLQRRNKDLSCSFTCGKDTDTGAEVGIGSFNVNTERNNLSQSLSQSPAVGGFDNVPLAKPVRNILSCSKGSATKAEKQRISAAKLWTVTGSVADNVEKSGRNEVQGGKKRKHSTTENIIVQNSNYKSGNQCESHPLNIENSTVGMFSSELVNKEDQFPNDVSTGTTVSEKTLGKKRKLLPLQRFNSPEMLDVSAVTEEPCVSSVLCPYTTEEKTTGRRKRKALLIAGETSAMELTSCVPSTSTMKAQKHSRQFRKKFDSTSSGKHEAVSKVSFSTSRNSSDEFVRTAEVSTLEKPRKILERRLPSLVCTGLHRHEVEVVASVVRKLGGFIVEANVSEKTTHVVTQGSRRTINLLKGIARGCWIVLQEWVLKSLDADMWLEEDEFELADFSPAVKQCRLQKLSFGPVYKLDLFRTCGAICVSKESVPPKRDLEDLITLCGGHIVASVRCAHLLVGNGSCIRHEHVKHVNEKWVLDSIQFNTLRPVGEYTL